jgi:hypothetical protein
MERKHLPEWTFTSIMISRRRLVGAGVTAGVSVIAANLFGVVWDGDQLCHHYAQVSQAGTTESVPEDVVAVPFSKLERPAQKVVESVLDDGKYLACNPDSDRAFNAFLEQTMSESSTAMVVELDNRYHWFYYRIEDVFTGRRPPRD